MRPRLTTLLALLAVAAVAAVTASATAPPIGPLPRGPATVLTVPQGELFSLVVPRPAPGLAWRGARNTDVGVAKPLDEGELNGNIVFVYRALRPGRTTVAYALTRGEGPKALASRTFRVTVVRTRCSDDPAVAAQWIVPPPPFAARVVAVRRRSLPPGEPAGGGPARKRLYLVTFDVTAGNAVLPSGHRFTQFAYVARAAATSPWCFLKGGSGP